MKEIKGLIADSMAHVQGGNPVAAQAGTKIADIVGNAKRIDILMREVAHGTDEQGKASESPKSTKPSQARKLNEEISFFKL